MVRAKGVVEQFEVVYFMFLGFLFYVPFLFFCLTIWLLKFPEVLMY